VPSENYRVYRCCNPYKIGTGGVGAKIKNVIVVVPDVDVDVFRTQIDRTGTSRPRFLLFAPQDDEALRLSEAIWGTSRGSARSIRRRNHI